MVETTYMCTYIYTDMYIYIYINREMFTQKEQDELINSFLDVTKVSDYLKKLRELTKIAGARIVRHTIAIALYAKCHHQKVFFNNIYGFCLSVQQV